MPYRRHVPGPVAVAFVVAVALPDLADCNISIPWCRDPVFRWVQLCWVH